MFALNWGWGVLLVLALVVMLAALLGVVLALWWTQRHRASFLSIHVSQAQMAQPPKFEAANHSRINVPHDVAYGPHTVLHAQSFADTPAPALGAGSSPEGLLAPPAQALAEHLAPALQEALLPMLVHSLHDNLQRHLDQRLSQLVQELHESMSSPIQSQSVRHELLDPESRFDEGAFLSEIDPSTWQTLQENLVQARSQIAEQEQLTFSVSHDLRAPIRVVEGFARILKEDYADSLDRIGQDHLDRILGASARMNGMIDALLTLAQFSSQPLHRQPVQLSQLVQYVLDDLQRSELGRKLEVHITPDLQCSADPTLLRILLDNLLGNAWKYSSKKEITVIHFEAQTDDHGRTVYCVQDNGAGFDMRFADRLFGVFQRLHSASDFQGTGIGLASVRRIVRRHGGDIWAESVVGEGAKFYFTLAAPKFAGHQPSVLPADPVADSDATLCASTTL